MCLPKIYSRQAESDIKNPLSPGDSLRFLQDGCRGDRSHSSTLYEGKRRNLFRFVAWPLQAT